MSKFTLESKGLQEFANAMLNMPNKEFLGRLVHNAALTAKARIALRPDEMGATPGTKGEHSTGNTPTAGASFWRRGDGGYYVPKSGKKASKRKLLTAAVKRANSADLYNSWEISKGSRGMEANVRSTAPYAGYVQGGKQDKPTQSRIMKRRNWDTTDVAAKFVEQEIGVVVENTIQSFYKAFLAKHGITAR